MVCGVVELCRIIPCAQKYNKGFRAVLDAFLTKKSEQHILFNILLRWVMKRKFSDVFPDFLEPLKHTKYLHEFIILFIVDD